MKHTLRAFLLGALLAGAAACDDDPTGSGPPAQVAVASGGDQSGPAGQNLAEAVTVEVTDDDGDPVEGVEVRFSVSSGGGSVSQAADSTDARGLASVQWRLGTVAADSQRLQVQVMRRGGGGVAATTVVRATAQPLAGRTLVAVSGNAQTAGVNTALADSLTVRVVDELGNGVPGVAVTWTASQFGGTVSPTSAITRANGTARAAWTLGGATGGASVVASAPALQPVTFTATATSPFTITITQPIAGRAYGDSLPVRATAQSATGPITRMTARVEGRAVNLAAGQGTLDLAGLAEGEKVLLVWAVTAAGDSGAAARPFVLNRAPQLTAVGPISGSVIRGNTARIDAECTDPSGCTRVAVYASRYPDDSRSQWTLLAEGTTSFHGDVSLAAWNGQPATLFVEATDALGGRSVAAFSVFAENTPAWTEVASGGLRALDVDATRILYVDSTGGALRLFLRARGGGAATELLAVPAGQNLETARLFPGGAIFATRTAIHEYRSGAVSLLATTSAFITHTLDVQGTWAAWNVGNTLYRRDLAGGTTVVVSTTADNGSHVGPNGDVAYRATGDDEIYRWRDGVSTPVSNGLRGYVPVTDGTQVVWGTGTSIYLWRGPGTAELLTSLAVTPTTPSFYEANGGWAAFVRPDAGGMGSVFTVAPDGTRRAASFGGDSRIAALGPDGSVVYLRLVNPLFRRFATRPPYTAQPVDIGANLGEIRFIGTELYVFVGRSVFRVSY